MASCTCADPRAVVEAINQHEKMLDKSFNTTEGGFHKTFYGADMKIDTKHSSASYVVDGEGPGGKPSAGLAPIRFSNWAAPEISDEGLSLWGMAWRVAAMTIALLSANKQEQIAKLQEDLSDKYYNMAKEKQARFFEKYVPLEKQLLTEARAEKEPELDCAADRNRAEAAVESSYGMASKYLSNKVKSMRVCLNSSMDKRYNLRKARTLVDTENYNLADDRWFTDYLSDRRWNRRSNILNMGRNLPDDAFKYAEVARASASKAGDMYGAFGSAIMNAVGYYGARNDTYYPNLFLSGYGGLSNQLISTSTNAQSYQPGSLGAGVV